LENTACRIDFRGKDAIKSRIFRKILKKNNLLRERDVVLSGKHDVNANGVKAPHDVCTGVQFPIGTAPDALPSDAATL
jgi:hypothetical protein